MSNDFSPLFSNFVPSTQPSLFSPLHLSFKVQKELYKRFIKF